MENSNGIILAGTAVVLGVVTFLIARLGSGAQSLATLQTDAIPLDEALRNGKPTVVEFYANWCEVCKEMASDTLEIKNRYSNKVNFVMLNVENTKWASEITEYNVRGIPEYIFLDKNGAP